MLSSLLLGLLAPAHAAIPVLVAPFEAQDRQATELALRMPAILRAELEADPDMQVLDPAAIPDIGDTAAALYLEVCPPGQLEGCSYVVGEAGGAAYAVLGTVRTLEPQPAPFSLDDAEVLDSADQTEPELETEITLRILDVKFYNEVLQVVLVHTPSTEDSFADAVLLMMQDAAAGWVGGEVDIRTTVAAPEPSRVNQGEAQRELDDLSQELGEVEGQGRASSAGEPSREDRPRLTMEQLLARDDPSAWQDLDLSARQYLSWWNSGWNFASWSKRLDGRRGQLLLRAHGGLGLGPTHALYYGREAYRTTASSTLLEEVYVTHELATGLSSHAGLSVGYGITPSLEIEAGASREGGRYAVDARYVFLPDGDEADRQITDDPQGTPQVYLGVRWAPLPASPLRPVGGLGVAWWFGHTLGDDDLPTGDMPAFTAPLLTPLRALAGAELRLMPGLDAVLMVPIHLIVAGQDPALYDDMRIDGPDYGLSDKREATRPFPLAGGLQLGVQARLGGRGVKVGGPQVYDEELDELE